MNSVELYCVVHAPPLVDLRWMCGKFTRKFPFLCISMRSEVMFMCVAYSRRFQRIQLTDCCPHASHIQCAWVGHCCSFIVHKRKWKSICVCLSSTFVCGVLGLCILTLTQFDTVMKSLLSFIVLIIAIVWSAHTNNTIYCVLDARLAVLIDSHDCSVFEWLWTRNTHLCVWVCARSVFIVAIE